MKKKFILVVNAGSSSLKFKLFDFFKLVEVKSGIVERVGLPKSFIKVGESKEYCPAADHSQAFEQMIKKIAEYKSEIAVVGHRVVHGGERFTQPTLITAKVLRELKKYNKLAPLHNPVNIKCILASRRYLPGVEDVAVFDTAFYRTLPEYAYIYPVPYSLYEKYQIRRYGFHGISHQYIAEQSALRLKKSLNKVNVISCHLGSGCSVTAIRNGQAVDTSMGFTPLEGLMMSTRSGNIDPALPLYLIRDLKMTENQVDKLLNKESGLKGLAGSMDMREVMIMAGYKVPGFNLKKEISAKQRHLARLTLEVFVYYIKKYIGAYSYVLGRVDAICFTAGIGERNQLIRQMVMTGLPKITTLVIPANEELMIAKQVKKILK